MNLVTDNALIVKIQNWLNCLATTANQLRKDNEQVYYELHISTIYFDDFLSFEQNLKNHFIELSKHHQTYPTQKATDFNKNHFNSWCFELKIEPAHLVAIQEFFKFINISNNELNELCQTFIKFFENDFGGIIEISTGYISPPYQYNPYSQHWEHLYIKTPHSHFLITLEADT